MLSWATASETNNSGFLIQKSLDGIHFNTIGMVEGKGTFEGTSTYYFTDESLSEGVNYYRLMQQDFDGQTHASEIRTIRSGASSEVTVYPNPFMDKVTISVFDQEAPVFYVYDMLGQEILRGIKFTTSGNDYTLDLGNLSEGVYFIGVQTSENNRICRVVKR